MYIPCSFGICSCQMRHNCEFVTRKYNILTFLTFRPATNNNWCQRIAKSGKRFKWKTISEIMSVYGQTEHSMAMIHIHKASVSKCHPTVQCRTGEHPLISMTIYTLKNCLILQTLLCLVSAPGVSTVWTRWLVASLEPLTQTSFVERVSACFAFH